MATGRAVILVLALGAGAAEAQGTDGRGSGASQVGSPLPGGGTTRDLTMPGNGGVAGTGLGGSADGKSSGKPIGDAGTLSAPGTGMSVKGPAGQGIDGQGRTAGGNAGDTDGAGSPNGSTGSAAATGSGAGGSPGK